MRALLICPSDRTSLAFLSRERPLALLPVLGRSVLDLWLTELATRGARRVTLLAADRPEQIRRAVGKGERWGLEIEIVPETREVSPDEARARYQVEGSGRWLRAPLDVGVADRLPGGEAPWRDPKDWFIAIRGYQDAAAVKAVGFREFSPGVRVHVRARVAPTAQLTAPCWIGAHVAIGTRARVGPGSVIEDGAYVDDDAEVVGSFVAPGTYVGAMTELRESLAWGRRLCKWTTGSFTEVIDEFLLGDVRRQAARHRRRSFIGRAAALLALGLLSPVVLVAWLRRKPGEPLLRSRQALRTPAGDVDHAGTFLYHELSGVSGLWRRWPELWNIVRGDSAWVGNRPLTRQQARELETDFERLWLGVPPGLVSLSDAEGCEDPFGDEGRAHASFYAVQNNWRSDLKILWRVWTCAFPRLH
jgi:hypothetical protein